MEHALRSWRIKRVRTSLLLTASTLATRPAATGSRSE
jgi:hypothetical protein